MSYYTVSFCPIKSSFLFFFLLLPFFSSIVPPTFGYSAFCISQRGDDITMARTTTVKYADAVKTTSFLLHLVIFLMMHLALSSSSSSCIVIAQPDRCSFVFEESGKLGVLRWRLKRFMACWMDGCVQTSASYSLTVRLHITASDDHDGF
jgi:hypothetical protein